MLDAFPDNFAEVPGVMAGAIALDDDELTCANLEVAIKLSEGFPEGVELMEEILWLISYEEVIAVVVAMVGGVPETER